MTLTDDEIRELLALEAALPARAWSWGETTESHMEYSVRARKCALIARINLRKLCEENLRLRSANRRLRDVCSRFHLTKDDGA